jgi:hypothetical protein
MASIRRPKSVVGMSNRLFVFASGVSIALLAAVVGLWVRSYRVVGADELKYRSRVGASSHVLVFAYSYRGRVGVLLDRYTYARGDRSAFIEDSRGGLEHARPLWEVSYLSRYGDEQKAGEPQARPSLLRFYFAQETEHGTWNIGSLAYSRYRVNVPHWSFALPLAICPAVAGWRVLKRRRLRRSERCLHCGYDLRASNERCPECGTPVPIPRTNSS